MLNLIFLFTKRHKEIDKTAVTAKITGFFWRLTSGGGGGVTIG